MNYLLNPNSTDAQEADNEVHTTECTWGKLVSNPIALGSHTDCTSAVALAKAKGYSKANGCVHCSSLCHTG